MPVSIVQDDKELSSTYGKEKLPKSFEDMQRHGLQEKNEFKYIDSENTRSNATLSG